MNILPRKEIPDDILKDSVLAHIAAAYFSVGKRLERKTQCSATRGFILSTLRGGTALNSNQIKSLVKEGLVSEHRAESGRAIPVQLTAKGRKYRERLIEARVAADESVRRQMTSEERETLLRLLTLVAECDF
jgi:predicted MarR family transcription regulator